MTEIQEILNNLFGINNETSAPIIITLIVFILGYLIAYFVKFITGLLNRFSKRKLFFELLKEIASSVLIQAENFKEYADTLIITNESGFKLKRENINHLSNLNKLDFETIHAAFFSGIENWLFISHSRKKFNEVWSGISKIIYWETIYHTEVERFIDKFNFYENKRNELIDKFRTLYESFNQLIHGQKVNRDYAEYITGLQNKVKEWINMPNRVHYYNAQQGLVLPIIDHNNKYPEYDISLQLNNILLEASYYYENLDIHLETHQELILSYERMYKNIGQTITKYYKNYNC